MNKTQILLKHTSTYGAISGFMLIIASVIFYMFNIMPINFGKIALTGFFNYAIIIVLVIIGTKAYRDKVLGGVISYRDAFLAGLLIILFSSVLSGFYSLIFTTWIDPDYVTRLYTAMKDWMFDLLSRAGYPEEMIDQTIERMEQQEANYSPLMSFFTGIGSMVIVGAIICLITSAFIKKNPDPFTEIN